MRWECAAFAAFALVAATPSLAWSPPKPSADEAAVAAKDGVVDARSLTLAVQGTIRQQCAIGNVGDMNFGDLNRVGLSATARVAFSCNIPFAMSIRGQNGALTHRTMPNGQGPYGGKVPYSIGVKMAVRHPSESIINRVFSGSEVQSGGLVSSDGGIATDGMIIDVALGRPSGEAGLLAGEYAETITITVMPT